MEDKQLLIMGVTPPPIGGVSMHVMRLLSYLSCQGMHYKFIDIRNSSLPFIVRGLIEAQVIHLHTSNSYLRLFILILARLYGIKTIFTFHGNLGRYHLLRNTLDRISIKLADIPVMVNVASYTKAERLNANTRLIPAFIPPTEDEKLSGDTLGKIRGLKSNYRYIFATNAFGLGYDKFGREIYQILLLVKIFKDLDDRALVISDPSGAYSAHFARTKLTLPPNICIITGSHCFYEVLKLSDVFLRITTTDGDSLSLKEALCLNKAAIATDVVSRPEGVILTELTDEDVRKSITTYSSQDKLAHTEIINGAKMLMEVYHQVIDSKAESIG